VVPVKFNKWWPTFSLPPINLYSFGKEDSPCQGTCEREGDKCKGCHRTVDEITDWAILDPEERYEILKRVCKEDPNLRKRR
jgi:predicted Fe-S protein YdhL (DUF1289 family)